MKFSLVLFLATIHSVTGFWELWAGGNDGNSNNTEAAVAEIAAVVPADVHKALVDEHLSAAAATSTAA